MLQSVPPTYRPSLETLLEALKQGNDSSKKLYYNFKTESRVKKSVGRAFGRNLKAQIDKGISAPRDLIEKSITKDLALKGPVPKPKSKLPQRYAIVDDAESIARFRFNRTRAAGLSIKEEKIVEVLLKYIDEDDEAALKRKIKDSIDHRKKGFVWIGDAGELEKRYRSMDHDNLRDRLGLAAKQKGARLVLMTFPPENINPDTNDRTPRLPTVIEAGCFEPFTPAEASETLSGKVINLKTGKRTCREWVCQKVSTRENFKFIRLTGPKKIKDRPLEKSPAITFLRLYAKMVDQGKV